MANPKTLKPPFKKGYDPRRHIKQKGEVSFNKKFKEFILDWCMRKKKNPQEIQDETWRIWQKMYKKDWRALDRILTEFYGEPGEKDGIKISGIEKVKIEIIKKENGAKS